ncbi:MAG: FAD-binding oxidoreductase [archaeon]|nr:FAD-binding oxidoreductase [archaeon]
MMSTYDVIIIGAGSLGVPTALAMAKDELKVLVLDSLPSIGQSDNKHAIGGIRATHTQKAKIWLCQRSIEIFSNWQENYGDDISWVQGGYTYVAYTEEHERLFRNNIKLQKSFGLNIDFYGPDKIKELIPGINSDGLRGGTFSPNDGSASPLQALNAFYQQAIKYGADFKFKEEVLDILVEDNEVVGVRSSKGNYHSNFVINAAGASAKIVGKMVGIDLPIEPDSHEGGITEPVKLFFKTMVIDIRPNENKILGNSKNYYFYQNIEGQVIFCITPDPPILGTNREETSSFLPQVAARMVNLLPRLKNLKVRRTWRGLYPMSPDGSPIIGFINNPKGYINAVGPCGQGFMLGPGLGEFLSRLVRNKLTERDRIILNELSLYRDFSSKEKLK